MPPLLCVCFDHVSGPVEWIRVSVRCVCVAGVVVCALLCLFMCVFLCVLLCCVRCFLTLRAFGLVGCGDLSACVCAGDVVVSYVCLFVIIGEFVWFSLRVLCSSFCLSVCSDMGCVGAFCCFFVCVVLVLFSYCLCECLCRCLCLRRCLVFRVLTYVVTCMYRRVRAGEI